ncbi:MAG TPA: YraN family protein [Flavitalea sp.]|nr:YraN family protein [Flavitalea sp.]
MRDHMGTGKKGELLAAKYLLDLGFNILHCNWRYRKAEIDIIASKDSILHFIEVKTRTSLVFGYPEESVSNKKIRTLIRGGAAYCYTNPGWPNIQFDVLSIILLENQQPEFLLLSDVYL